MAGLLAYFLSGRLPILSSAILNLIQKIYFQAGHGVHDSGKIALKLWKITAAGTARESNPVPYYPIFRKGDQNHNRIKYTDY
jgi:hypothetical protein